MIKNFRFEYHVYHQNDALSEEHKTLLYAAKDAQLRAYAPYSMFTVGAAIYLANGTIITGNNQENAAYPSGLCAERVAIFSAKSQFPDIAISSIAIYAGNDKFPLSIPVSPCGACRQSILEYELLQKSPIEVLLASHVSPIYLIPSIKFLLPLHFEEDRLKKE